MKKLIYSFIILFVLLSVGVVATTRDDLLGFTRAYYPMGNVTDLKGGYHATDGSSANYTTTACPIGGCRYFDGVDDYWTLPNTLFNMRYSKVTMCAWIKPVIGDSSQDFAISMRYNTHLTMMTNSSHFYINTQDSTGWKGVGYPYKGRSVFSLYCLVKYGANTNASLYINGTYKTSVAVTGNATGTWTNRIGEEPGGTLELDWEGVIDELMFFTNSLTTAQMAYMYSNTSWFYVEPFSPPPDPRAGTKIGTVIGERFILEDFENDTIWKNFTGFGTGSQTVDYLQWNNTHKTEGSYSGMGVLDYSKDPDVKLGIFQDTTRKYNLSYYKNGKLKMGIWVNSSSCYGTTTQPYGYIYLANTEASGGRFYFPITITSNYWYNLTWNINATNATFGSGLNMSKNITVLGIVMPDECDYSFLVDNFYIYNPKPFINGSVTDGYTITSINTFNITAYNTTHTFFNTTITGTVFLFHNLTGDYIFWTQSDGYNSNKTIISLNNSNYNFHTTLYHNLSLNFSVYDEETDQLLIGNVSVQVISSDYSMNQTYTTNPFNFSFYQTSTTPDIEIRYSKIGYDGRSRYFKVNGSLSPSYRLYLLNSSIGEQFLPTVTDQSGKNLEGIVVRAQRYFTSCTCYRTVEESKTDFVGKSSLNLKFSTSEQKAWYTIQLLQNNILKFTSTPLLIKEQSPTFKMTIGNVPLSSFSRIDNIDSSLTFNNATSQFIWTYSDSNNLISEAQLLVIRINNFNSQTICDTSTTEQTGTITCIINRTFPGEYVAKTYIETNTEYSIYQHNILSVFALDSTNKPLSLVDNEGLLFLITLVPIIGLVAASPVLMIVFTAVAFVAMYFLGVSVISSFVLVAYLVIAAILLFRNRSD